MERYQLIELVDGLEKVYSSSPLLVEEALGEIKNILKEPELKVLTREQVEKAWRGEWINKHSAYDHKIFTCAQCGKQISIQGENLDFCPKCGSAQTDEAVNIVMKRLEGLKDGL